ncbi:MAG: hypothetical protein HY721_09080 [Planctomycetes bacterium]|nr:hypothetical protein [Planctomycetota bacterium]
MNAWFIAGCNPALNHARITSPKSSHYNCIAWAAGTNAEWWWPDPFGVYYWPQDVPRLETLDAFLAAYSTLCYESCGDGSLEAGFEKVAVYANAQGVPTHAARQLPSGRWTSKVGALEDIEHDSLAALTGAAYGRPARFMKRRLEGMSSEGST